MRHIILTIVLFCSSVLGSVAQEGLGVANVFDGRYKNNVNAVEVRVEGRRLKEYNLAMFRSLTLKNMPEEFRRIEEWVRMDSRLAVDKESGLIGGKLYYGFYLLPPKGDKYRYLFYRNSSLRGSENNEVTVVYMEGYATLEELKKMFK